jgi:hypothetical protein
MHCTNCGALLPEGSAFCTSCGAKIDTSGTAIGPSKTVEKSPNGMTILVFGILSLVVCSLFGIAAWIMGNKERKLYPEDENVKIGRILGIVGTILTIVGVGFSLLYVIFMVIMFVVAGVSGGSMDSLGGSFFD